jgi:hypothetical protein
MEFIEAPPFTRRLADYLNDEEFIRLQTWINRNPEVGDLIPGHGWISENALGRCPAWQGPARRAADYLLLSPVRPSDMVDDTLWQE